MVDIQKQIVSQLALLREKDEAFRRRLAVLREEYGGGARVSDELDELEAADRAFAARVEGFGWAEFARTSRARLQAAFAEEAPVGDEAGRVVFYCDLERGELGLRGRGAGGRKGRPRMFGNREVVLDLGAEFDALIGGGQHSSNVYPIVFSHDAERNRRLIVAVLMLGIVWPLVWELQGGAGDLRLEIAGSASGSVLLELRGAEDAARVSAVQLGFGGEREIERRLREYVAIDPEANFRSLVKTRRVGAYERRDFAEPFGRTWSVRLERAACRVAFLSRERPVLTIKRALRFVDPVAHVRDERDFADEAQAEAGYLAAIQAQIEEGFRQVFVEVRDEAGAVVEQRGDALSWEDPVQK